jgi:di/tricarboxylate transporter
VVILIAAIFIVGEALVNTGVAHRLGEAILKAGASNETRLIVLVMLLAGGIGAFMSSSAIVAMLIPVVLTIANKTGLNRKRMLMPLSIAPLISGMMTLIASSPNMIIDNTLCARPRFAQLLQLDPIRPCCANHRDRVYAAGGTPPAEQATCR